MRVPGLARKFWTITSCRWPYRSCKSRSATSASSRSARVSPIPIRIPLVNGIRSSPANSIVSRRRAGSLSGEAQCGPPFAASRSAVVSSMIPIEAETGRSATSSSRLITPGIQVRQQAGFVQHELRDTAQVLDRRLAPERRSSSRATL